MIVPIIAILIALAGCGIVAWNGFRGSVRIPYRGGGGRRLNGAPAYVAGVFATLLGLMLIANLALLLWPKDKDLPWPTGTFSIIAIDSTGDMGGAVQSRVFSVGNGVLWAESGVGVAATQAVVDVSYGPQALALLRQGVLAPDVVKQVLANDADPRPTDWSKEGRQFAVLDAKGNIVAHTGPKATEWAGNKSCAPPHKCSAQGNILAGPAVVDSMVAAFERTPGRLAARLVAALEGGQRAGGDKRGQQSAALIIVNVKKGCGIWLNNDVILRLQVDDNPEPIKELRRLVELQAAQRRSRSC